MGSQDREVVIMRMDGSTCTPGYLLCCLLPGYLLPATCYLLPATCYLPAQNHISTGSREGRKEGTRR